ncbi:hypothetical protein LLEC1_07560 [Akanthomyces lecanii]|uniref:Protein kinase domain-containing protein n=1 Tax=Cordyceps confragosa TaxID=2714763 RepID=A0A179IIH5_CORDF|nr:hypothetical protein LLEC1_07560 [Akanthomyces lecanii]
MDDFHCMPEQLDQFLYTGNYARVEDLTRYKHHGFHPIILGDVLPKPGAHVGHPNRVPRYRILLKLGFGAFATVWLARDLVNKRCVSLKVCVGSDAPEVSTETAILSELRKPGQDKVGFERIIQLLDVFTIKGPNGFHECLVTEVISPLSDPDVMDHCSSAATYQILEGFSFLHEQGIAHGDPHLANFGVALPQLEQFNADDITEYFANPEVIPVVPRDPSFPLSSIPPYVTPCVSIADFLQSMKSFPAEPTMCIKILDFGRAHRTSDKPTSLPGAAPIMVRPPEVVLHDKSGGRAGSVWSESADIWAVGCIIYQIESGSELISTWGSLDDYLLRTFQLGGPPPNAWSSFWTTGSGHGNEQYAKTWPETDGGDFRSRDEAWRKHEAGRSSSRSSRDGKRQLFLDLVKKMIVTDPDERSPMADLLGHSYFSKGKKAEAINGPGQAT